MICFAKPDWIFPLQEHFADSGEMAVTLPAGENVGNGWPCQIHNIFCHRFLAALEPDATTIAQP